MKNTNRKCVVLLETIFLVVVSNVAISNSTTTYAADLKSAIEYYKQAETLFNVKQYQDALPLYYKAVSEYSHDGRIAVDEVIKVQTIPYGRSSKQIIEKDILYEDYYPNRRIRFINERTLEQTRLAHPPVLTLRWIALRDPSRDQVLNGGETVTVVVNVDNIGKSDALDVVIVTKMSDSEFLTFNQDIYVGTVSPQQGKTVEVDIEVARDITDKNNTINIVAREKGGFASNELDVTIVTKTHRPAKLAFEDFSVLDRSADTLIEPGEPVTIATRIVNTGLGVAEAVFARVELGENVYLGPESQDKYPLGDIYPGESKDFSFTFLTNGKFTNNQAIPVAISASEQIEKNSINIRRDLRLTMRVPVNKKIVSIDLTRNDNLPKNEDLSVDVDNNIPSTRTQKNDAIAVVIGNRNYQQSTVPLVSYALNDAEIIKKYLVKIMGYRERNIIDLRDATSAKFNETFGSHQNYAGKLFNYIKPGKSDVFIYYSGHGAPDLKNKNAYFVPVDVDPAYIATSGYSLELFYRNISKLDAKSITIVLDTCFSGNSNAGSVIPGVRPASIRLNVLRPHLKNTTIFTSSGAHEISTWYSAKRHGLFTYYFLKGLRGLADQNNDDTVTNSELGQYLSSHVPYEARRQGHEQSPSLVQSRDFIIADYRR